jgi:hypothetical protein
MRLPSKNSIENKNNIVTKLWRRRRRSGLENPASKSSPTWLLAPERGELGTRDLDQSAHASAAQSSPSARDEDDPSIVWTSALSLSLSLSLALSRSRSPPDPPPTPAPWLGQHLSSSSSSTCPAAAVPLCPYCKAGPILAEPGKSS